MSASRVLLSGVAVSVLLGLAVSWGAPEEGKLKAKPKPQAQKIALLDINHVFKNHQGLKAAREELRKDAERADAEVQREREEIKTMQALLEGFKKGSDDYEAAEKQIAERTAALNVQVALQRKQFMKREAENYYQLYRRVMEEVQECVRANQIAVVLRFDASPGDPADPDSVVRLLNRDVIYWEDALDITPAILERVNRKAE